MGIYLCFKIYFLIDTNAKKWTEIIDLVVLGRNYWSSCRVWMEKVNCIFCKVFGTEPSRHASVSRMFISRMIGHGFELHQLNFTLYFHSIGWIQWQNMCHYSKRARTCNLLCKRPWWSLNWAQFMLHWFIRFPEFTEFLTHLVKSPMPACRYVKEILAAMLSAKDVSRCCTRDASQGTCNLYARKGKWGNFC